MTTTQEQLAFIKSRCVLANKPKYWEDYGLIEASDYINTRTIRLADILYAIGKTNNRTIAVDRTGGFLSYKYEDGWQVTEYKEVYNLLNDTIDNQSPELIAFVANILAINEE